MPSRKLPKKGKLREDANETAYRVLQEALGERERTKPPEDRSDEDKDLEAVKRGRKGGEKGGKARAETLTSDQRREIAERAANARWNDEGDPPVSEGD